MIRKNKKFIDPRYFMDEKTIQEQLAPPGVSEVAEQPQLGDRKAEMSGENWREMAMDISETGIIEQYTGQVLDLDVLTTALYNAFHGR